MMGRACIATEMPLNRNVSEAGPFPYTSFVPGLIIMDDREQLSALIGDIYDAVFDPAHRTGVLDGIADFVGGHSGGLLSKHSLGKSLGKAEHLYCCIGNDPDSLRAYSESYPKLDSTADPLSV